MKKRYLLLLPTLLLVRNVNAAAYVSPSYNTVTTGNYVRFTATLTGAAAWNISGSSTGATTGCSLREVGDSGTGKNTTRYISADCYASNVGQIGFTISGDYTDQDGNVHSISDGATVKVVAPRQADSNNYLSSLGIEGYEITPAFNKDTLEYSVTVPASVSTVKVTATKDSQYASDPVGTGDIEVSEGLNKLKVTVTSETSVLREYTINVTVKDENPIKVNINSNEYTIVKNSKNLTKPDSFESTKIKINDIEVPAFKNETLNIILVGIKDESGNVYLAIYDESKKEYKIFNSNKSSILNLYIMNVFEEKEGFHKSSIKVNGNTYEGLVSDVDNSIILVYARNLSDGYVNYYLYNENNNTFTIYNDSITKSVNEELSRYKQVLLAGSGVIGFLVLVNIILLFKKTKRKVIYKEAISIDDSSKVENTIQEHKPTKKELKALRKEEKRKKKLEEKEISNEEDTSLEKDNKEEVKEDQKDETKELSRTDVIKKVKNAEKMLDNYENKGKDRFKKKKAVEEEYASLDKTSEIKVDKLKEKLEETKENVKIEVEEEVNDEDEMFDLLTDGKKSKKRK